MIKAFANREWIYPLWDKPSSVHSVITTRLSGFSEVPYDSLNLGDHVGDQVDTVSKNRLLVSEIIKAKPIWLTQVHGKHVVTIDEATQGEIKADAAITRSQNIACTVMLADCLPVLLCNRGGTVVAAIHGGWKGLAQGIIEETISQMNTAPQQILAYLGPCIGETCFKVQDDVRDIFLSLNPQNESYFRWNETGWLCDLVGIATLQLKLLGVEAIWSSGRCTFCDDRFFSYRREGITGRFASLIWLNSSKTFPAFIDPYYMI